MTAGGAVAGLAIRQIRRPALIVAAICAGLSALVAAQYRTTFSGALDRRALDALAENPAIRVLFGPPVALDDPGGFTVWRMGTPVVVLAAVWVMLAAIRITRGEEDTGRWDLLLAGRLHLVDVLTRCVATLTGAAAVIGATVGAAMVAAGTGSSGAMVYAVGIFGVTAVFAGIGVLAAQLMPSRTAAVGLAVGVLGAALLLRMVADGVPALAWSAWLTPFGLVVRAAPYAENRIAPLAVLIGLSVAAAVVAVALARRRDVGGGWVAPRTTRAPRTALLGSVGGFAVRRGVRPTAGWAAGIGAYFVIVGAMIASIIEFLAQNPRFSELAAGVGFAGLGSARGFAAALFGLLAIPAGLYAATRLAALVADERARRWTMVFAAPVSRSLLLGSEIVAVAAAVLLLHAVAGVAMWVGAVLTSGSLGIGDALAGALNTAPISLLSAGAAALAAGWLPSLVGVVGAVPVVGGFLLNVVAESTRAPSGMRDLSPFVHIPAVPVAPPAWTAAGVFVVTAAVLAVIGVAGYRLRDLTT